MGRDTAGLVRDGEGSREDQSCKAAKRAQFSQSVLDRAALSKVYGA